jgi:Mg2+ and Co2+ transporter CorA
MIKKTKNTFNHHFTFTILSKISNGYRPSQIADHENQPSKIEEYDEYLFTIIDGVSYEEMKIGEKQRNNKTEDVKYDLNLIEDDLYIIFESRWIITINFLNQKFQENIRRRIKNLQQHILKYSDSKQQQPSSEDNDVSNL